MPRGISEPAAIYWAIGIVISVALHATGVAGAVLLTQGFVGKAPPTEITFSDEASPIAASVPAEAEVAVRGESAPIADRATLAPSIAEATESSTRETLQPAETSAAAVAQALQPQQLESLEALRETVQPAASPQAATDSRAEKASVLADSEVVRPSESAERLPPSVPSTASYQAVETTAERVAALVQPEEDRTVLALAPDDAQVPQPLTERVPAEALGPTPASPLPTATSLEPEALQPALEPQDVVPETAAALSSRPETASPVGPSIEATTSLLPESIEPATGPMGSGTETATALPAQPEALQPALRPIDSGVEPASALSTAPEISSPVNPAVETVAGSGREVLQPTVRPLDTEAVPAVVIPQQPEAATPVEQPVETALLVPARPDSVLGTEIDKPSDRYRRIVDFIREFPAGDCFIALPAMNPDGDVTFQTFGRDKAREDAFKQALIGLDGLRAEISSGNVADPQCLALTFARSSKRYPGFSLMIDLDEADVASGSRLAGSVLNANERELHLLLVDDEGKVQSLDRFLEEGDGTDRPFEVPLNLTGGPVVTKQIVVAITAEPPLPLIEAPIGAPPASEFFAKLAEEIEATDADVDLAVEGFSVR